MSISELNNKTLLENQYTNFKNDVAGYNLCLENSEKEAELKKENIRKSIELLKANTEYESIASDAEKSLVEEWEKTLHVDVSEKTTP